MTKPVSRATSKTIHSRSTNLRDYTIVITWNSITDMWHASLKELPTLTAHSPGWLGVRTALAATLSEYQEARRDK